MQVSGKLFLASQMKLVRASVFIAELRSVLDQYVKDDPLSANIEFVVDHPQVSVSWKGIGLLPGAIVGDAIHNMRTALDLMASDLVRINEGNDKSVYFPFAGDETKLAAEIKKKNFDRAGDDAVALLRTFAPYKGGNESLRAIHDLDIEDKHRALILTVGTFNFEFDGAIDLENIDQRTASIIAKDVEFVFPPDGPLAGWPLLETMEKLLKLVQGIVEAFAGMVALRSSKGQR